MATAQPVYIKDNGFEHIALTNKWSNRPFHILRTFSDGTPGQSAQNNISGLKDGWDIDAGGSTYADEILFNGKQVCKCTINKDSWGDLYVGGALEKNVNGERGQSVWMRIIANLPTAFDLDEAVDKVKWLRQRVQGVGHADLYLPSPKTNYPAPINLNCEAHTSQVGGNIPNNGNREIGKGSGWELPRNEWFEMGFQVLHDHTKKDDGGACVVRVWAGDQLLDEITSVYTMISGTESIPVVRLMNYFNAPAKSGGGTGVTKDMHFYVAEIEVTNIPPSYTDAQGNPKLPTRI